VFGETKATKRLDNVHQLVNCDDFKREWGDCSWFVVLAMIGGHV